MAAESKLPALRAAVEDAYRIFETARPERWSGDDLNLGRDYWARLETVPLRELNRSDTYHFLSETGDFPRHEVRYMLPRVLELLAEGQDPHAAGIECSLNCLAQTGYPQDWVDREFAAVEAFYAALLDAVTSGEIRDATVGTYCCMVACAGGDLPAVLDRAARAEAQSLARAIALDIGMLGGIDESGELVNAFWENASEENRRAMIAWYCRPSLAADLERAFFAETDPEWQQRLSDALETARRWPRPATPHPLDPRPLAS